MTPVSNLITMNPDTRTIREDKREVMRIELQQWMEDRVQVAFNRAHLSLSDRKRKALATSLIDDFTQNAPGCIRFRQLLALVALVRATDKQEIKG